MLVYKPNFGLLNKLDHQFGFDLKSFKVIKLSGWPCIKGCATFGVFGTTKLLKEDVSTCTELGDSTCMALSDPTCTELLSWCVQSNTNKNCFS
jgi:hypothetical protein